MDERVSTDYYKSKEALCSEKEMVPQLTGFSRKNRDL